MKLARDAKQNRTTIGGLEVFPEEADRNIMAIARLLASQSIEGSGSILVATRDGDFTLTARARLRNALVMVLSRIAKC